MDLTEEQKQTVAVWVKDGITPGEVQRRIKEDFGLTLTYLDLRLLLDDLQVVPEEPEPEPEEDEKSAETTDEAFDEEPEVLPGTGRVSVTIDQITRPNAMISGKVTFSDGQKAEWSLDTMGRLGLNPDTPGYRPTQDDIMAFQMELQRVARQAGMG
jgi:hypothetical protein